MVTEVILNSDLGDCPNRLGRYQIWLKLTVGDSAPPNFSTENRLSPISHRCSQLTSCHLQAVGAAASNLKAV